MSDDITQLNDPDFLAEYSRTRENLEALSDRMRELTEVIGVDRRTVERWRAWWRDSFTTTPFWKVAHAAFMPPVDPGQLPAALIERGYKAYKGRVDPTGICATRRISDRVMCGKRQPG